MAQQKINKNQIEGPTLAVAGNNTVTGIPTSGGASKAVTIPTQPDTSYWVVLTRRGNPAYWSDVQYTVSSRSTSSFTISVYNSSSNGTPGSLGFDYAVFRND